MKLVCLAAVLVVAVLVSPPVNAMHGIQKRAAPGTWASADATSVENEIGQLPNAQELYESVLDILSAADALPRSVPNLLAAIVNAVNEAFFLSDYKNPSDSNSQLVENLLDAVQKLVSDALNANASPSAVSNSLKQVVAASQTVACTHSCGSFSSSSYSTRLQSDIQSGSTTAIVTDCFVLPQAAILSFGLHSPNAVAMPTIELLDNIKVLLIACINQDTAALASAIENVLVQVNVIAASD